MNCNILTSKITISWGGGGRREGNSSFDASNCVVFVTLALNLSGLKAGSTTFVETSAYFAFLESQNLSKIEERTSCDRLEFTLVDQTVRRFVRPDDLFVYLCENAY